MHLTVKTPAGTLHAKPFKKKHLDRITELLSTVENEFDRGELEIILLWEVIQFSTPIDYAAFLTLESAYQEDILKDYRVSSALHYLLHYDPKDKPMKVDGKPSEALLRPSLVQRGRELLLKLRGA